MLVQQIEKGEPRVEIAYTRGVKPEGNLKALERMHNVFDTAGASWRGIGEIPGSGLNLKLKYARFDAGRAFNVVLPPAREAPGCRCGEVLRGVMRPVDCPLFAGICTPAQPLGPCMVSTEGACAAAYRYER